MTLPVSDAEPAAPRIVIGGRFWWAVTFAVTTGLGWLMLLPPR
jgi:hypothetical protein